MQAIPGHGNEYITSQKHEALKGADASLTKNHLIYNLETKDRQKKRLGRSIQQPNKSSEITHRPKIFI